jgi:hypothetical protein
LETNNSLDLQIQDCLKELGISSPVDWDVLVFVYRHKASLANADQIARLLGYSGNAVGDALDNLESLKLIQRSRASQGVRLYQFVSSGVDVAIDSCFWQLIGLAQNREGRLLLIKQLRRRRSGLFLAERKDQNG